MKESRAFTIELESETYMFYSEIAELLSRSINDILSDTLYKYADIVMTAATKDSTENNQLHFYKK